MGVKRAWRPRRGAGREGAGRLSPGSRRAFTMPDPLSHTSADTSPSSAICVRRRPSRRSGRGIRACRSPPAATAQASHDRTNAWPQQLSTRIPRRPRARSRRWAPLPDCRLKIKMEMVRSFLQLLAERAQARAGLRGRARPRLRVPNSGRKPRGRSGQRGGGAAARGRARSVGPSP